ncbi:hypothetical protein [Serinicoccus kebangsaanensis]|uniref:hypothetical protein n=1 Tax=Serinicoccus kebangsaanensis TaxID=2602069 RepID=UPI00124CB4E8|nr:hypothetical protein [Serinicoccus kebangsaanensis]
MSILLIGMVALTLTVILAVVGVTAVQLTRIQLLDAADAAALDASDALAQEQVYEAGLGAGPPVSDATVVDAAAEHLAGRERPSRVQEWGLGAGTGTPDGRTAVVTLTGRASIPVISPVLATFGGGVTITVTSSARSEVEG